MGKSSTTNARYLIDKAGKEVNTKFLNSLPPEWSKFVTDVKLVRDFHTTNFDQLNAYLEQHELHANEVRIMRERNQDPLALSPQYGSIHPTQHYSTTYPSTPHAITYTSSPHPNAYSSTIHQDACPQPQSIPQIEYTVSTVNQQTYLAKFPQIDSGLAVHVFKQGDDPIDAINKMMSFLSTVVSSRFPTTNNQLRNSFNPRQQETIHDGSQQRVVKCFNCQGEGHMAKQCPKPKKKRDATWFRDKVLLVEAQGSSKVLNKEELEFLADPGVAEAKAVLMANLTSYRSDFLSKAPHSENTHNDMLNQSYLLETQNAAVQDTNSSAQQDAMEIYMLERYKEWVKLLEERQNVDLSTREKLIMDDIIREKNALFADLEKEINYLKQTLSEQSKEKELLTKTFNVFKNESKEKEAKNIDKEIALEKKVKELDNIVCKMGQYVQTVHMLMKPQVFYDNNLKQALETLMLEEESRSKMLLKQSDPMVLEKKVNIKPINYAELNRLSEDFGKHFFFSQQELYDEQAFRLQTLHPNTDQSASLPVKIEAPRELPKVSLVNTSLKRLKYHLGQFDNVVKKRITLDALTEGEWGFEQTKAIVEQAKSLNHLDSASPLDSASYYACKYVKLIQELLGYVRDTCLDIHKPSEKLVAVTPNNKKKTVRVSRSTKSNMSKSIDNIKNDRILQISSSTQKKKKNKVEDHSRIVKSSLNKLNCVVEPSGSAHVQHSRLNTNSKLISKSKSVKKAKKKEEWKPIGKVFTKIGYNWRPTGRTFTLVGNACPLTRITATNKVPLREPIPLEVVAQESVVTKVYTRRPKVAQIVLWYLDSGCSKHMTRDCSQLTNFVHKFLGTVKFGNDQIEKIMGYGDYQIGNITISRVYYVEWLGYNLFSVGQFCDSNLEVAFRKHTCFVCNMEGDDLLSGSQETNFYILSMGDMMVSSIIFRLSKAPKTKSWLWHRRLSHLNFGAINHLAKNGLVQGLPKLKFEKDHLCSACAMIKSKKQSHKPKSEDANQEKLYLLHMDLCRPMRVASINREKYILIIVDDYSRFIWVKFLASKDEAPNFMFKFLKMIQVRLNTPVRNIHTDNGTEFVNQTLRSYYENVGISHETLVMRSLQQMVSLKGEISLPHVTPNLSYLHVFGILCYPNNDSEDLGKLQAKADIVQDSFQTLLLQYHLYHHRGMNGILCFNKCLMSSPPDSVASPVPVVEALAQIESTGSPSSTSVDQDALSPSTSQSTHQSQSHVIPLSAKEESHDLEVAHMSNDTYFGISIPNTVSKESSSLDVIPNTVHSDAPIS
ncbi:retrovirus-related pol polyprotein from transposon TNT 1-94 [Tanacetum coccineum]